MKNQTTKKSSPILAAVGIILLPAILALPITLLVDSYLENFATMAHIAAAIKFCAIGVIQLSIWWLLFRRR